MKQPDYAELGDSPAAQRLYAELQAHPRLRKRVYCSLQKWTEILHGVKESKFRPMLCRLIREAFGKAVENDMQLPEAMKIGLRSVFCTRYKKMLKGEQKTQRAGCQQCAQTKALLQNPVAVEINMKRGIITLPPWKRMCGIYGKEDEYRRALEAELKATRAPAPARAAKVSGGEGD